MKKEGESVDTPLIRQYFKVKSEHPEALLLFRVGDFYETYGDDAAISSKVLGIVLTRRANGPGQYIELAGFPHHAIESYLPKLIRAGYKVAVCDQLEDPKLAKKLVKRGITELVTPGIAYSENILNQRENNFLCAVYFEKDRGGVAFLDISTGTFRVSQGALDYLGVLLADFAPREVVLRKGYEKGFSEKFGDKFYISVMDEWAFVPEACEEKLKKQFDIDTLKGFGISDMPLAVTAAGAVLFYLEQNRNSGLSQICSISRIDEGSFVWMDKFTIRNLEIFSPAGSPDGVSLIQVMDRCVSPPGARLLRSWISMPLKDIKALDGRLSVVEYFVRERNKCDNVRTLLSNVGDLERITARAAAGKISPREVVQLKRGLEQAGPLKKICEESANGALSGIGLQISVFEELRSYIGKVMKSEPAAQFGKGDIIADGVSSELDELRNIARHGKETLAGIQKREAERTGIPSLKISYNNVFGYYLEVRNAYKEKVPPEWIRKQTLVNAERYITEELKEYEEKILGAEDKIYALEVSIYQEVIKEIQKESKAIQETCGALASLDCLAGFADLALRNNYCRPHINDSLSIDIRQGRHPVIETMMAPGEEYVANDLFIDNNSQQIIILTGPNMAGKSALLRQTALIVLMAQVGSFVPAKTAEIGVVDKIFTRVGASDNISRGESTFMVEMLESATILHNLSARSLILLDEIGRGTSTFDGMSIAWAIVEYIHKNPGHAKTLFATHYHELNELERLYPRVKNYHISVKEVGNKVIFLRKLCKGGVERSFGLNVARMAGMPAAVIESAEKKLRLMEKQRKESSSVKHVSELEDGGLQLSLYQLDDPLLLEIKNKLKDADINSMSPLDAFDLLRELKKEIGVDRQNKNS
ncbi:MAG: DNA mismatch repair protein MutS [Bacteroidales bacterium]|nr:DNA mismatch repair protein MutS [Bacteroidales bacterium]